VSTDFKEIYILGIESSCDDTAAAIIRNQYLLSNIISNQKVHQNFGGVVPELASRAHQQNIIPVVDEALKQAGIEKSQLSAIAFTRGPGLLGSLLVGVSFSKALGMALNIPIIEVDHLQAHILAHFIQTDHDPKEVPGFPFLCLTVSGGHTQIVKVSGYQEMEIVGRTIDDAAGEAFDKAAKIMGLPYPGGPMIDKIGSTGNPDRFTFAQPSVQGLDYSFSGLKTSILYFIRDQLKHNPGFIEENKADLCASVQKTIIEILMVKLIKAAALHNIRDVAIAGGVSANSALRKKITETGAQKGWRVFIPKFEYTTDNAAMISITGYYKYLENNFASQGLTAYARSTG